VRVLGIDPGLTRCGFGVVEGTIGVAPRLIEVGVVRTDAGSETAHRLLRLETALEEWVGTHRPDVVAVERVFAQHNVQTVMGTAQAAGIAMLVAARHQLPVALHTPSEVKAAITGSGRADKAQVGAMVTRVLRLAETPKPADAADALALAICHLWRGSATDRIARAAEAGARQADRQRRAYALARQAAAGARKQPTDPVADAAVKTAGGTATTTAKGARA
jgi:crossover junction endodeoxyribonuclease RuvC